MIQLIEKLYLSNSILTISVIDNNIVIIDASYYLYVYNLEKKRFLAKKQIQLREPAYKYIKAIKINTKGYASIVYDDDKKVYIYKFENMNLTFLKAFDYHKSKVEVSALYENKYLSTGGEDGRVYLYDLEHLQLLDDIYVRPEFISSIFFSENGNQIFCSSFDKNAIIYSTQTAKILKKFAFDDIIEGGVFFGTKVLLLQRDGTSAIYDLKKRSIISKEKNSLAGWPTKIVRLETNYALIATRSNLLYVLDLSTNSISFWIDMETKDISSLYVYENKIFVGFVTGEVKVIDYKYGYEELIITLKLKNFEKINKLLENNKFLMLSEEMANFNKEWKAVFDRAKIYILDSKDNEARELVRPFMNDKRRELEFNQYMQSRQDIVAFIKDVEKKDLISAFKKADNNHFLKTLPLYEKVELAWESIFNKAKLLLEEDSNNKLTAMRLLQPYSNVESKKSLISNLLNNTDVFSKCEKLVKERKFKEYFGMVAKYIFLKDTMLYRKVMTLANKLYQDMMSYFDKDDFVKTSEVIAILKNFEPFEKKALEVDELSKVKQSFIHYLDTNKKICFDLLIKYTFLQQTKEYDKLMKDFELRIDRAKEYAYEGKIDKVEKVLKEYINLDYTIDKVAEVYKIAYINEFDKNYEKYKDIDIRAVLNNYIQRFGQDIFLLTILKNKNLLSFVEDIDDTQIQGYKKLGFINSIFIT